MEVINVGYYFEQLSNINRTLKDKDIAKRAKENIKDYKDIIIRDILENNVITYG